MSNLIYKGALLGGSGTGLTGVDDRIRSALVLWKLFCSIRATQQFLVKARDAVQRGCSTSGKPQ